MARKQLPIELQKQEITWGNRYLLFQLVFLGPLLSFLFAVFFPNRHIDINTAYFLINIVAVVWIFHRFLWHSLKYAIANRGRLLLSVILGFAVYWILIHGLDRLIYWLRPQFENANDTSIAQSAQSQFWLTAFGTVILVPLTEETLFRGLIFGAVHRKKPIIAYAISILFFSMVHVLGYVGVKPPLELLLALLQYIPAGLVLAWSYEYSGTILAPLFIHTAINAIAIFSMR
jgi:membrane protease YdiL (CAAX protease family)